jgi:uncharacterized protein YuzE
MKLIRNDAADTAYLSLTGGKATEAATSQQVLPPRARDATSYLVLEFDDEGHLLGIQFLSPQDQLLPDVFAEADRPRADG